jgi:transposase-like protein
VFGLFLMLQAALPTARRILRSNARERECRERAVRLAMEHRDAYRSEAALVTAIASKLGCSPDSLRVWVRQARRGGGERSGQSSAEKARIKALEREVREQRQANEILKKASAYFAPLW